MTTLLEIYNLALTKVGSTDLLVSTSEVSHEATLCNLHYPLMRDTVMAAAFWQTNKTYARLTLNKERDQEIDWATTEPDPEWQFRYALPADYLRARYLADYTNFDISSTTGVRYLQTNTEDAILCYSRVEDDPTFLLAEETTALVAALASALAIPLTGKRSLASDLVQEANALITASRVSSANSQSSRQMESLPDWLAIRGYVDIIPGTIRFIYPNGNYLSVYNG